MAIMDTGVLVSVTLVAITVFLYLYWFFKKAHRYFDENGIPNIRPKTFLGHMPEVLLMRKCIIFAFKDLYWKLAPYKFIGYYNLHKPFILVRDPDLIKHILVKDFGYFQNHGFHFNKEIEPMTNHLFNLKDDEWRNLRIKLTSTFTTGKMKMMFPLMRECAENLNLVLDDMASSGEEFDIKDLSARYTTDVIGSCAFGVETYSLKDADSEFRKMGKRIFDIRIQLVIRSMFPNMPTNIVKLFRMYAFPMDASEYFRSLVAKMVKHREENNITRYDFLDLLIGLKNNTQIEKFKDLKEEEDMKKFMEQVGDKHVKSNVDMTVDLMAAQCFLFFIAGFEGSASTISLLLLELSRKKILQHKLREEVRSVLRKNNGTLTYEALKDMRYLDMVVSETFRRYPLTGFLNRQCNENYKIPGTDTIIKKGMQINIPVSGLHSDKQYYERPDEFYPEHFTEEAIARRHNYVYLPFGEGPRICIAQRFARMTIKTAVVYAIRDCEYDLSPRTKMPLEFEPAAALLKVKGGCWVRCRKVAKSD